MVVDDLGLDAQTLCRLHRWLRPEAANECGHLTEPGMSLMNHTADFLAGFLLLLEPTSIRTHLHSVHTTHPLGENRQRIPLFLAASWAS